MILILSSYSIAQNKKLYLNGGGAISGIGNYNVQNHYKEFNNEYTLGSDINFKSSLNLSLGIGYDINSYLSFELNFQTLSLKYIHREEYAYGDDIMKLTGYSFYPFAKIRYPLINNLEIYTGFGYAYNKIDKSFSYSYNSSPIIGSIVISTKTTSEDLSSGSWIAKLGVQYKLSRIFKVYFESSLNHIKKRINNPYYDDGSGNNDPRNRGPVDTMYYTEIIFNHISISAGISYYIF